MTKRIISIIEIFFAINILGMSIAAADVVIIGEDPMVICVNESECIIDRYCQGDDCWERSDEGMVELDSEPTDLNEAIE